MELQIKCSKCGEVMLVDDDTIKVARENNIPIPSEHTQCPRDRAIQPVYVVRTSIVRYPSYESYEQGEDALDLAAFGGHAEGPTLNAVFEKVEAEVNLQWAQVRGMRNIIEDGSEHSEPEPNKEKNA